MAEACGVYSISVHGKQAADTCLWGIGTMFAYIICS